KSLLGTTDSYAEEPRHIPRRTGPGRLGDAAGAACGHAMTLTRRCGGRTIEDRVAPIATAHNLSVRTLRQLEVAHPAGPAPKRVSARWKTGALPAGDDGSGRGVL